jgi:hypothetical protein
MRMVITKRNIDRVAAGTAGPVPDTYRERLLKYIPAEVIAVYVALYGIAYAVAAYDPLFPPVARWILIAGVMATPVYLWKAEGVTDAVQLAISTAGFLLWACALGVEPVAGLAGYNQVAASLALPAYVFLTPFIEGIPERW